VDSLARHRGVLVRLIQRPAARRDPRHPAPRARTAPRRGALDQIVDRGVRSRCGAAICGRARDHPFGYEQPRPTHLASWTGPAFPTPAPATSARRPMPSAGRRRECPGVGDARTGARARNPASGTCGERQPGETERRGRVSFETRRGRSPPFSFCSGGSADAVDSVGSCSVRGDVRPMPVRRRPSTP
jgi:hypothetical protein